MLRGLGFGMWEMFCQKVLRPLFYFGFVIWVATSSIWCQLLTLFLQQSSCAERVFFFAVIHGN
jgi:hypothetical protein